MKPGICTFTQQEKFAQQEKQSSLKKSICFGANSFNVFGMAKFYQSKKLK